MLGKLAHSLRGLAVLCLLGALVNAGNARADEAASIVEDLHAVLLEVMKNAENLGFQGRFDRLAPVLSGVYDHPYMARAAVSRQVWKKLDAAQRERLTMAFARFSVAEYASRFDGWDGQALPVLGEEDARGGTRLVRSKIGRGDRDDVAITYLLRKNKVGQWRIIDVFLDGAISELAKRRSEYMAVFQRNGFDGLVQAVEAKTQKLGATSS